MFVPKFMLRSVKTILLSVFVIVAVSIGLVKPASAATSSLNLRQHSEDGEHRRLLAVKGEEFNDCLQGPTRTGKALQCTANDVSISQVKNLSPTTIACNGDPISFLAEVCLLSTATIRYDVAVHFGLNGVSAKECDATKDPSGTFSFIIPTSADDPDWGPGPFQDIDDDNCGDITSEAGLVCANVVLTDIACVDNDGDGLLNIPWCTSWDNNDKEECTDIKDALPGTGSKCFCGDIVVDILVCDLAAYLIKAPDSCESTNTGRSTTTFTGTPSGTSDLQCRYTVTRDGSDVTGAIGPLGDFGPCIADTPYTSLSLEDWGLGTGTFDVTFEVRGEVNCPTVESDTATFTVTEVSIETDATLYEDCQDGFEYEVIASSTGTTVSSNCWNFYQVDSGTHSCDGDEISGDAIGADGSIDVMAMDSIEPGAWFGRVVVHGANGCSVVAYTDSVSVFEHLTASLEKGPASCESMSTGRSTTTFTGTPGGGDNLQCRYMVDVDGTRKEIGDLGAFAPCTRDTPYTPLDLEEFGLGTGTFDVTFEVQDLNRFTTCPTATAIDSFEVTEVAIGTGPTLYELCQDGFEYEVAVLGIGTVVSSYCWNFYQGESETFSCDIDGISGDASDAIGSTFHSPAVVDAGKWFGRVVVYGANGCSIVATAESVSVFEQLTASLEKAPTSCCGSANTGRSTTTFTGTPDGGDNLQCRYIVVLEGQEREIGDLGAFAPCTRDTPYIPLSLEELGLGTGTFDVTFEVWDMDRDSTCSTATTIDSFEVTEVAIDKDPTLYELCQDGFEYEVSALGTGTVVSSYCWNFFQGESETFSCDDDSLSGDASDASGSTYQSSGVIDAGEWFGRVIVYGANGCSAVAAAESISVFEQLTASLDKGPDGCETTNTGRSTSTFTGTPGGGDNLQCRYKVELEGLKRAIGDPGLFAPCTRDTPYTPLNLEELGLGTGFFDVTFEVRDLDRYSTCATVTAVESFEVTEFTIGTPTLYERCMDGFEYEVSTSGTGTVVSSYCWNFYQVEPESFSCDDISISGDASDAGRSVYPSSGYIDEGNWFGRVVVHGANGCSIVEEASSPVPVYAPLELAGSAVEGSCENSFTYSASATGGDGNYKFAWSYNINGASETTFTELTSPSSGVHSVDEAPNRVQQVISATLDLSDGRCATFDPGCCQSGSDTTTVYSPLAVTISGASESCSPTGASDISESVDILPDVTGGDGSYVYMLDGPGCESGSCSCGPDSCLIDVSHDCLLATYTVDVDDENLCSGSDSITIEKATTLTFT